MKTLTAKNQKTLEALKAKANGQGRMPSIKRIASLLTELNIEHKLETWSETKTTKPAGYRYTTGGGTKLYEGYRLTANLKNTNTRLSMETTCTYYSWNTWSYASEIIAEIEAN